MGKQRPRPKKPTRGGGRRPSAGRESARSRSGGDTIFAEAERYFDKLSVRAREFYDESVQDVGEWVQDVLDDYSIPVDLAAGNVSGIQRRLDALTKKAQQGKLFTAAEKAFLTDLYDWLATGGRWKWMKTDTFSPGAGLWEAGELLSHYLHGKGATLKISSDVYEDSVIVQFAMSEIKKVIRNDIETTGKIRTNGEIWSTHVVKNKKFGDANKYGEVRDGGVLLAEQQNQRLKYANNRFVLKSKSHLRDKHVWDASSDRKVRTNWRVDDRWDYASFREQAKRGTSHITAIPLPGGSRLQLHDGLSHYMTTQGVAQEFDYYAVWSEDWEFSVT